MKVVFLDIDGVLVTEKTWETSIGEFAAFDQDCVQALNHLLARTGAKVVVSSTWRFASSPEALKAFFHDQGVAADIIGVTPDGEGMDRSLEVELWLKGVADVDSFVVIDNGTIEGELEARHVQTHFRTGLCGEHVAEAIELLEQPLACS